MLTFFIVLLMAYSRGIAAAEWSQINTPHVRLIFKPGMTEEAQRLANTLDHLYVPNSQSLNVLPAPISLVLWDQNFQPNALVGWLPRRMEFYNAPTPDYGFLGTNDWLDLIAVHEYRHVVQNAKLQKNFNQLLYYFGGEIAQAPVLFFLVPNWFFEGDAVLMETALTKSGRGRYPAFSLLYRMNLLEHGGFSYAKQVFRSLKHKVPDHYHIGYYLVTHLRRKYGSEVFDKILSKTTWLIPFTIAVKQVTGRSMAQVYQDANEELKALWQGQLEGLVITPAQSIVKRNSATYTDYRFPHVNSRGEVIVLKSGLDTAKEFVLLTPSQQEVPLFAPGTVHKNVSFTVAKDQIVWTEQVPHYGSILDGYPVPISWNKEYYGVIQRYDMKKKCLKTLTHQSRYQAAALSPDAQKIVAVETTPSYQHRLVILNAEDGKVLHRLPNPQNCFYMTPRWLADNQRIVAVKHQNSQAALTLFDTLTDASEDLLPYSTENIGVPVPCGQYVLYGSAYNGIDNIYALDLKSQKRYQVTSRKYGAYHPTLSQDGRWILFNDFTKHGMDVAKIPFEPQSWTPLEEVEDRTVHYYAPIVEQENNADILDSIPTNRYPIKPYVPWKYAFNVHSWIYDTVSSGKPEIGINIHSKDVLDTTDLQIGYMHNVYNERETLGSLMQTVAGESWDILDPNEKTGLYDGLNKLGKSFNDVKDIKKHTKTGFVKLIYRGLYPIIEVEGKLKKKPQDVGIAIDKSLSLDIKFPLTLKRGQYTHYATIASKHEIKRATTDKIANEDFFNTMYEQTYTGYITRYGARAPRDLTHRWKQALIVSYTRTPYYQSKARKHDKETWTVTPRFFFPGLAEHHSLEVRPRFEHLYYQISREDKFKGDLFEETRRDKSEWDFIRKDGLSKFADSFDKVCDSYSIQGTYRWPIAYPELDLGGWLYIQQLSGRAFCEIDHKKHRYKITYKVSKLNRDSDPFETVRCLQIGPAIDIGVPLNPILKVRAEPMLTFSSTAGWGWGLQFETAHSVF